MLHVLLSTLTLSACAFALPPTRTEVGRTARPDYNGTQIAVGADLGSALPTKVSRFEVGLGFIGRTREESGDLNWQKGGYLDLGFAALNSKYARVLVGVRGERYGKKGELKVAKLRIDAEVLGHVTGGGADAGGDGLAIGGALGNIGVGVFAEAGRSFSMSDDMVDSRAIGWMASAGVTMRLPAFGAIVIPMGKGSGGHRSYGSSGSSWRNH